MIRRNAHCSSAQSGMTLIEVLLALSIVAIIVAGIGGGIQFGRQLWFVDRQADDQRRLEEALNGARYLISRAYPLSSLAPGKGLQLVFIGTPESVTLTWLSDGQAERGGFIHGEIAFERAQGEKHGRLAYRGNIYRAETAWSRPFAVSKPTEIGRDLLAVRFLYFGARAPTEAKEWHGSWVDAARLPELIRLEIDAANGQTARTEITIRQGG